MVLSIRLHIPSTPNNGLRKVIEQWESPADSSGLLEPFPDHFSDELVPIPCHSHNDYSRRVPLFQALAAGCISVEADIHLPSPEYIKQHSLRDDDLLVGHSRSSLRPDRTLRALYTEPLLRIFTEMYQLNTSDSQLNGVFANEPAQPLTLLLDFKESHQPALSESWDRMQSHLSQFRSSEGQYLTSYSEGKLIVRALTIVVSGNAPFDYTLDPVRNQWKDVFFDAPLHNLTQSIFPQDSADTSGVFESPYNISNSYFASTSLSKHIGRPGLISGLFSSSQVDKMQTQISQARELGLVSRYWGTPGWPVDVRSDTWRLLWKLGVGVVNVDAVDMASRWNWRPAEEGGGGLGWCRVVGRWVGKGGGC